MKIVLLSGGSGQRLWPLSNDSRSKQYIDFINHDPEVDNEFLLSGRDEKCSMLCRVYEQLMAVGMNGNVIVAASEAQRELVAAQLGPEVMFSSEPLRRDTFPAVLLASSFVHSKLGAGLDEVVAFMPVDPYVNLDYFRTLIKLGNAVENAEKTSMAGAIGLMGATPTYPSEKYGYILKDDSRSRCLCDGVFSVSGFAEKPSFEKAEKLISKGALWNCGVFCFKLGTAREWAEKYDLPFDYDTLSTEDNYSLLPARSFDYEILESAGNVISLQYTGMWKDIGTWNTLSEEMTEQSLGNVAIDGTTSGCNVINTLDVPVVVMGGSNLVVAASSDGILVADKEQSSYLKEILKNLDTTPRFEERRWGTVKTVDRQVEDGQGVCTNIVHVKEGQFTTYHRHLLHDEVITVVSGEGALVLDRTRVPIKAGSAVTIGRGALHAIKAYTKLKYVEVLIGEIDADDIERISFEIPCMDN